MNTSPSPRHRRVWPRALPALLLAAAAALPACRSGDKPGILARFNRQPTPPATPITVDGRFDDWPATVATTADGEWIYFKVTVPEGAAPLQAAPETLALWLDADGSAGTGSQMAEPAEAAGMGVDLFAEFSPRPPAGAEPGAGPKRGVAVYAAGPDGASTPIPSAEAQVLGAPTFASDTFEIRLSRRIDPEVAPDLARLLRSRARARAMFALIRQDGTLQGWSDPETFQLPPFADEPRPSDAELPPKPDGAVRVMSWNVLKGAPAQNPSPFARVIQVVNPDVILFQEWETDAASAQAWFTATVTGDKVWNAWAAPGSGIVIVSPHAIASLGPQSIMLDNGNGGGEGNGGGNGGGGRASPVRFAGATISTPGGPVAAGSLHLKCCGTAGSSEDRRRINEAEAINAALNSALGRAGAPIRVLGGDFNLVGSRAPLDALRAGLDADGTELAVAETPVLGDAAVYTWSDHKTEFPDGRLDYIIYSDATAELVNAFVLDNRRLSDRALARLGLDREDTAASDHFPVVVDLRPRQ